ncbi:MAG: TOBE domain-containing protein, partial [Desulfobacterales bacterium]|nr:TOBE domain-containing protein [Desulfobacterales bacterium]
TISLANKIAIMEYGSIAQVGTPQEVFQRPKSEFVALFIGVKNFFYGKLDSPDRETTDSSKTKSFITDNLSISVHTDHMPGFGNVSIGSDEIIIANKKPSSSARNIFKGTVKDISNARSGTEVLVDIGREITVLITPESVVSMDLTCGSHVWIEFKATAVKFFPN